VGRDSDFVKVMEDLAQPATTRRTKSLLRGIAGSVVSRGLGVLAPLLLIPVMLRYLGPTYAGLWMTLIAVAALTVFADLGLGNGLMTRLPPALASNDLALARRLVSSSYAVLSVIALTVTAFLWATLPLGLWSSVFDPQGVADPRAVNLLAVACLTAFTVNVPCALVTRLFYATQRAASAALWQAAASLAPILPVLVFVGLDAGPVAVVLVSVIAGPVVNLISTGWFFTRISPTLRPARALVAWNDMGGMLKLGAQFFALTVALVVANSLDNLIIAQVLGLAAVTAFAVPARVFLQLGQVVSLINVPLWAANADALSRGEIAWVRRVTRRMILVSTAALVTVSVPLVLFGEELISLWTGEPFDVPVLLTSGLAVWWLLMASLSPLFMVQNAAGVIRPQLVGWSAYAILSIPAKAYVAATEGAAAVPWVGVGLLIVTVVPTALHGYRVAMRQVASTGTAKVSATQVAADG